MSASVEELRRNWAKAIDDDKPQKAAAALAALEAAEPRQPQWPHRLGDALRRTGKTKDAEDAYERAMKMYQSQGFLPRALAMAKLIVSVNPARASIVESLDPDAAKSLRRKSRPPPPMHSFAAPAKALVFDLEEPAPASRIAGAPVAAMRVVANAPRLVPATDAANDEVRFANVNEEQLEELDVADLEPLEEEEAAAPPVPKKRAPMPSDISAEHLSLMSASTLFAEVDRDALAELARVTELVELEPGGVVFTKGAAADALYVVAIGSARVELPLATGGGIDLGEGAIFGEGCLLEEGARGATVRAATSLTLLRIAKSALDLVVAKHAGVGEVLFDLLIQRLITNTIQASPLFAAFDPPTRRDVARLFEIRRAAAGVALTETGKRSDGLYIALAGEFETVSASGGHRLALGSTFGHESLLSPSPAPNTVRCVHESVVLRLPAARFGAFAMEYPPALAHLAEMRDA